MTPKLVLEMDDSIFRESIFRDYGSQYKLLQRSGDTLIRPLFAKVPKSYVAICVNPSLWF